MRRVAIPCLLGILSLAGCLDRCTGRVAGHFKTPPDDVVREKVKAGLEKAKDLATNACGTPATGLRDVTIQSTKPGVAIPWSGEVRFEGKPAGAQPAKGNAVKALVCIGVATYTIHSVVGSNGEVTGWDLKSLDLSAVETPGVKWTPPPPESSGWDD